MMDSLEKAVLRFCNQLEREGYQTDHQLVGGVFVITAREWGTGAPLHYAASRKEVGFAIEEVVLG